MTDKGERELLIADNGIGMAKDFDPRKTESLGLRIILNLVEKQLQGKVDVKVVNGVKFIIRFKEPDRPKRI